MRRLSGYPPEIILPYAANDAERQAIHEGNLRHLDWAAAALLVQLASHHRNDWQDPRHAVFARRVMRMVAEHLRERAQ